MTGVDIQDPSGREGKLKLTLVEKMVLGGAFALLSGLIGWSFNKFDGRLDEQSKAMQMISTQQAVTNANLVNLSQQLSNVPQLTSDVATLKVQVARNTSDVHELQQSRKQQ